MLDALPEGLDAEVDERGRSFSGGQRQRLVLARALLTDAEIARAGRADERRRRPHRSAHRRSPARGRDGRTTVVVTTSPLVLDQADRVVLIEDGRVVAEGTHRDLLRSTPEYRLVVTRGEDDEHSAADRRG